MARSARRHYRVAKKEIQHRPEKGRFISKKREKKLLTVFVVFAAAVFIKGFLLGMLLGKNNRSE